MKKVQKDFFFLFCEETVESVKRELELQNLITRVYFAAVIRILKNN